MALASAGVIRMVLAPAATMFSIAVTCPALSPSILPAAEMIFAPSLAASASAPSFIFTKKGLLSVFSNEANDGLIGCLSATENEQHTGSSYKVLDFHLDFPFVLTSERLVMTKKCRWQWLPRWFLGSGFLWRETRGSGRQ